MRILHLCDNYFHLSAYLLNSNDFQDRFNLDLPIDFRLAKFNFFLQLQNHLYLKYYCFEYYYYY
jgi:hypothetical protein